MTTSTIASDAVLRSRRSGLRRLIWLVLVCSVLGSGYGIFLRLTRIVPPPIDAETRQRAELPLVEKGARSYVGDQYLTRERGIWEIHLAGEPYAMGWAMGKLASHLLADQEDYMFSEMNKYVPSVIARWLIRAGVRLQYRNLAASIPPARMQELAGIARAMVDLHGDFLPGFHRVVFYHALHDITQGLEHSPMLGCTAFAASGSATANGHLIIGRNFDFEGPTIFDGEKAVLFYRPAGKIPFAHVAWAGMTGAVTGINAEGIYISINAARTDDKGHEGVPVELLLRQVLEEAHSLDEAIALVKKTPVMVPDFYLIGDGKTGESAVVERSPTRAEVRRTGPRGGITILANHALQPAFAGDAENDRLRRYLTSGARHKRMSEVVQKWSGSIDPKRAVEILRDKRGPNGEVVGLGNRNALDAIIATHSVVVDATSMILWVGEGPHALGRYVGFDLRRELLGENHPQPLDIAADPIKDTEEFAAYTQAMQAMKSAQEFAGPLPERAVEQAQRAAALEETMPEPHLLLGDLLTKLNRIDEAKQHYQRFLELTPPYLKDVERVRAILGIN